MQPDQKAPICREDMGNKMKINALNSGKVIIAAAVGALVAGVALAQTAAPVAKPAATSTAPGSAAVAAKPRPHRDAPMHAPSFDDLDTNHDGVVSKAEFEAWRTAHPMAGHPGGQGGEAGRDGDGGHQHGGWSHEGGGHEGWGGGFEMRRKMMWMHMREMEMHHGRGGRFGPHVDFETADTDHDGKISWAEFQAAATAKLKDHFDHLDANHDGFIEKDELHGPHDHHHDGKDGKGAKDAAPAASSTSAN